MIGAVASTHIWSAAAIFLGLVAIWFAYQAGIEGWVDLGFGYIPKWFAVC